MPARKPILALAALTMTLLLLMGGIIAAQDATPETTPEGTPAQPGGEAVTSGVAVTVYNQGTALIQDRRTFTLQQGINTIDFTDVAASIDATSVSFRSLTDPEGTYVLEQNYVFDLVNSAALLERYIDEVIEVTVEDGTTFRGQLLSGRNGEIILRQEDGQIIVVSLANARDVRFPELPDGLITRPTLRWLVEAAQSGDQQVELTYLTGGLSWTADYILLLSTDNTSLDLNGWVTLSNTSGATYRDAQLKLVAGDVNRVAPEAMVMDFAEADMARAVPSAPPVEQREFFEYQLYEVQRPVTIADNESKQVEFVTGAGIPGSTFYVYDGSPAFFNYGYAQTDQYYGQTGVTDVQNWLEFTTSEDGGVGADLPAGRVRVYQEDTDGAALLIGENTIDQTPMGEDVQLYLGNAFDLVGERIQTEYRLVSSNVLQETYEIRLRNRKDDETVEIRVPENLFRWSNWEILNASHEFSQLNSNTIEFRVQVEPGAEVVITYTVQYSWPG
ncbi:MAG: DUF4139 domain-containing protein [bacterium]|nr:DUF4139 domain-containing protein [bacterium]